MPFVVNDGRCKMDDGTVPPTLCPLWLMMEDVKCKMDDDSMPNSVPSASFSLRSSRLKKEPDNLMLSIFYKLQFFTTIT
jgi:hypothetical protein